MVHTGSPWGSAPARRHPAQRDPTLAGVLSFLFVGAGQLYNGEPGKAIGMFFGCILLWMVLLGWVVNIWSIVDAVQTAKERNQRLLPP
ncbi:MAG: hypothetical protein EA398_13555 [Deltaproteobacteria bacterium]|nr:MAG: hypothetical protein EA398_13555 [Deltaproteobacteria bacterium]